ncbi:hypothetical protein ACIBHX_11490 [Nonomuraea sp. NPDC050536]|uniref:hypothetical protein n=1 Tax=Nonomuraea sp. NPDC050536 TaxID=3364366 RepID=UPI0037C7A8F1
MVGGLVYGARLARHGFSALYGAAGLAVAWLIDRMPAQSAIVVCALAAAVVILASSAADTRARRLAHAT